MAAEWLMFWDRNTDEIAPGPLRAIIKSVRKLLTDLGIEGGIAAGTTLTMGSVASGPSANAWLSGDLPDLALNLVLPKGDPGSGDSHTWGVVKQEAPLLVQLDGTVTQVGASTLVGGLALEQRVLVVRLGSELVVVGAQSGGLPVGSVTDYTGAVAPSGWLLCQGQTISRTTYARLYSVIGTNFGAGDGSTTFNLPAAGRVSVGRDPLQAEFATLGSVGGAKAHVLADGEMPVHDHIAPTGYFYVESPDGSMRRTTPVQTVDTPGESGVWRQRIAEVNGDPLPTAKAGGGQPHNNLQPYQVFNRIIKY